jgi:hypothetical protein
VLSSGREERDEKEPDEDHHPCDYAHRDRDDALCDRSLGRDFFTSVL